MVKESNFQKTLKSLIKEEEEENIKKNQKNNIKKEPPKPITPNQNTQIRQQETIKVNLTKKLIPTFAARESLSKEPPYPKNKKSIFRKCNK